MNEFQALKTDAQKIQAALDVATQNVDKLNAKFSEIKAKLTDSEQQLTESMYGLETAAAKYARSEIDESVLESFQTRVNTARDRRDTFIRAQTAAEQEISNAVAELKEIAATLHEKKRYAWIWIGDTELKKAAHLLSRAFVAYCCGDRCNSDMRGGSDTSFLTYEVRNAFLPEMAQAEKIAAKIEKEYFG